MGCHVSSFKAIELSKTTSAVFSKEPHSRSRCLETTRTRHVCFALHINRLGSINASKISIEKSVALSCCLTTNSYLVYTHPKDPPETSLIVSCRTTAEGRTNRPRCSAHSASHAFSVIPTAWVDSSNLLSLSQPRISPTAHLARPVGIQNDLWRIPGRLVQQAILFAAPRMHFGEEDPAVIVSRTSTEPKEICFLSKLASKPDPSGQTTI
jgi:hypothetical protein